MNTARAKRSGLSKPTVQTKKGRASTRQTGSRGILRYIAKGRAKRKAVTDDERIAVISQKLEPRLRDDKKRRPKVICIRIYPNSTRRMSRESAFLGKIRTLTGCSHCGTHLGQIPETNYERPNSIANPTALLHCIPVATLDLILDVELIVESGSPPVQHTNEVLAGAGSKG